MRLNSLNRILEPRPEVDSLTSPDTRHRTPDLNHSVCVRRLRRTCYNMFLILIQTFSSWFLKTSLWTWQCCHWSSAFCKHSYWSCLLVLHYLDTVFKLRSHTVCFHLVWLLSAAQANLILGESVFWSRISPMFWSSCWFPLNIWLLLHFYKDSSKHRTKILRSKLSGLILDAVASLL